MRASPTRRRASAGEPTAPAYRLDGALATRARCLSRRATSSTPRRAARYARGSAPSLSRTRRGAARRPVRANGAVAPSPCIDIVVGSAARKSSHVTSVRSRSRADGSETLTRTDASTISFCARGGSRATTAARASCALLSIHRARACASHLRRYVHERAATRHHLTSEARKPRAGVNVDECALRGLLAEPFRMRSSAGNRMKAPTVMRLRRELGALRGNRDAALIEACEELARRQPFVDGIVFARRDIRRRT